MGGHHTYEHFWLDPKFWVAVSFVIFVVLAARKGWAVITSILDRRAERVRAELDEAARLRTEAEAMLRQAEADRAAAQREAAELLTRARAEAERVAAAATAEAEAAAKRRERMAMDRIAAAEAGAVNDVRNAAAEIAAVAAREVLAQSVDAKADAVLIDRAVADLPRALRAA
jgi:F-type H+-transporting ATPase subunit b